MLDLIENQCRQLDREAAPTKNNPKKEEVGLIENIIGY